MCVVFVHMHKRVNELINENINECRCLRRKLDFHKDGVIGRCELSDMGAKNETGSL